MFVEVEKRFYVCFYCVTYLPTRNTFLLILLAIECDTIPEVNNTDEAHAVVNRNERNGTLLNGTGVQYKCNANYVTNVETSTCGVDGIWTPEFKCYPGRFLAHSHTFCSFFLQEILV